MNVYPSAVDAFLRGEINILTDTIVGQLVGPGYVYDEAHATVADLVDTIEDPVDLTVVSVADGAVYADPLVFPAVPAGPTVTGLVVHVEDGPLLCHIDRRADTVPLQFDLNGGELTFTFNRLFKL